MTAALRSGDISTLGDQAHAIKGASANLKALRMQQVAERLESAARAGNKEQLAMMVSELEREFDSTVQFLQQQVA
jgi:HPt (histidine-containing phosphotransfer) domain-containing protein